jgi:cell division protein FtsQ
VRSRTLIDVKRPEGFDRGPSPAASPARPARTQKPHPAARAERPRTPGIPRQERSAVPKPARPRTARAEFAAADRRRKREERAEVRRFTRTTRRRRLGWLSAAAIVALLAGLVVTAVFSPVLALRTVTVDGTQRLDPAALVDAVDGQLGTPLALLDEERIRTELGQFTLIRSYVTELAPPGTLLIHVVERAPVGVIASADGFRLVDPAGVEIETTLTQPEGYPLIELVSGEDVGAAGFRSMAEVLLALPPTVSGQVLSIAARTRDDVTLTLAGSSQRVVWGSAEDSAQKAATLAGLLALHQGDGPGEYDVSAPGIGVFHAD